MKYYKNVSGGYVVSYGIGSGAVEITKAEYESIKETSSLSPVAPSGYTFKLRADNIEWELVELPPVEPEHLTDEEALTRYANTITGASDPDLISAAETLITEKIKED